MAVERIDYYSDEEYEQALQEQYEREREEQYRQEREYMEYMKESLNTNLKED